LISHKDLLNNTLSIPQGVLPVVIRQILEAEEGLKLFEQNYSMLVFCAIVRNIDHSSTKITYLLEDNSGQIEGHYWLDNDGDNNQTPQVMLNSYAKIVGSARNAGGNKTLMIYKMIPIKQANRVTTHLLEVLNARYKAEAHSKKMETGDNESVSMTASQAGAPTNSYGLKGKHHSIFTAIQQHIGGESGISRQELERKLSHIQPSEMA
jgi:replication factor A2